MERNHLGLAPIKSRVRETHSMRTEPTYRADGLSVRLGKRREEGAFGRESYLKDKIEVSGKNLWRKKKEMRRAGKNINRQILMRMENWWLWRVGTHGETTGGKYLYRSMRRSER